MAEKCPKCGAQKTGPWPDSKPITFTCGSVIRASDDKVFQTMSCRITELTAENARLRALKKLWAVREDETLKRLWEELE